MALPLNGIQHHTCKHRDVQAGNGKQMQHPVRPKLLRLFPRQVASVPEQDPLYRPCLIQKQRIQISFEPFPNGEQPTVRIASVGKHRHASHTGSACQNPLVACLFPVLPRLYLRLKEKLIPVQKAVPLQHKNEMSFHPFAI